MTTTDLSTTGTELSVRNPESLLADDDLRTIRVFLTFLKDRGVQTMLNLAIIKELGVDDAPKMLGFALEDLFACTTDAENVPSPFSEVEASPVPDYPEKVVEAAPSLKIIADAVRKVDFVPDDFKPSERLVNICLAEFFRQQRVLVAEAKATTDEG
jgi:hypothetical protein